MPTHSGFTRMTLDAAADPTRRISAIDPKLSKSNYFDGKLLRASDLIRDQTYLDERLREAGRALGSGIVRGFAVDLALDGTLTVSPGLAIAPSGRVIEHEGPGALQVNLFDSADFAALNPDDSPRLERGLYAVAARLAERSEGAAEVFPADLQTTQSILPNAFTEGVELVLTDLRARLPGLSRDAGAVGPYARRGIADRTALAREFLAEEGQPAELDEDAVALGLLAVQDGGPIWLDQALVRRPQRPRGTKAVAQADLMTHHEEILTAIEADRVAAGRTGAFAATDYFDRLPPAGRMPVSGVNPAEGSQRFFPAGMNVSIAPVRDSDLGAILAEAALLDVIELDTKARTDIMVLVPLGEDTFDSLARRVELDPTEQTTRQGAFLSALESLDNSAATLGEARTRLSNYEQLAVARAPLKTNRLPSLGALELRARGTPPALDTDVAAWQAIQAEAARRQQMWFVRRAPRAAATNVSAVVAARGVALPPLSDAPPSELAQLREDLAAAVQTRDTALGRIAALDAQIVALEAALDADDGPTDADLLALRQSLEQTQNALDQANARIQGLEAELEACAELEDDLAGARAEIERLNGLLNDDSAGDQLRAENARLSGLLSTANRDVATARAARDRLRIDPADLLIARRIPDPDTLGAAQFVLGNVNNDDADIVSRAAMITPASLDNALWPSLREAVEKGFLLEFVSMLEDGLVSGDGLAKTQENFADLGISAPTVALWGNATQSGAETGSKSALFTLSAARRVEVAQPRTVKQLATERGVESQADIDALNEAVGGNRQNATDVQRALAAIPSEYDTLLWPTLVRVIERERLTTFADFAVEQAELGVPIGLAVAARSTALGLTAAQRTAWGNFDLDVAKKGGI